VEYFNDAWVIAVLQIIAIDIVLGGDNAIIIALACRNLPKHQRLAGILWGTAGAIILRVILVFFATSLMEIPGLRLVGGTLLIWIGIKLLNEVETHDLDGKINQSSNLLTAIRTIIIADFVMSLDNALAITAAACAALAQIQIRKMVQVERTSAIIFYFCITASVFSLSTIGTWEWPNMQQLLTLILIGILGGFGQIMLTTAYRYAPASVIAPFDYTAMIFALGIGYFAFAELPSAQMILGAGIVIAAGVFVILREARLGLRRGQARRAKPPPAL